MFIEFLTDSRTGLEHSAKTPENTTYSGSGAAESGVVFSSSERIDKDLQQIINSWVGLPNPLRQGILAMVKSYR